MIRFEGTLTPDAYRRALGIGGRPMQFVAWILILAGVINFYFADRAEPVAWAMPIFLVLFGVMLLVMPRGCEAIAFGAIRRGLLILRLASATDIVRTAR